MAKVIRIRAPKSMELRKMGAKEVEAQVSRMADQTLEHLPKDAVPVGVNAVSMGQMIPGSAVEGGVWAEWTRACCDRRNLIEEFVDPVVDQFEIAATPFSAELGGQHVESQMRIIDLERPTHRKADK
jgi:hypothetical protein